MLHIATLGRQEVVREIPRINRCGRAQFKKSPLGAVEEWD